MNIWKFHAWNMQVNKQEVVSAMEQETRKQLKLNKYKKNEKKMLVKV